MNTSIDENLAYTFIVSGVVLNKDDKYLLVQEKNPKCYGLWNLPAGKVEKDDSIEQTAIKEAKEETGYDVELIKKIDIYHEAVKKPVKHAFEAKIIGGVLNIPKDELLDAKWFTLTEISEMNERDALREEWVYDSVEKLEESKK